MKLKYFVGSVGFVICVLCSCSKDNSVAFSDLSNYSEAKTSIDTSIGLLEKNEALWICRGEAKTISEEEMHELLSNKREVQCYIPSEFDVVDNAKVSIEEMRLEFENPVRVSYIYQDAVSVGADFPISERAYVKCDADLNAETEENILSALESNFEFVANAQSPVSSTGIFNTEKVKNYYTVLFYPEKYVLTGVYSVGEDRYSIRISFPCVNVLGSLDGIFLLDNSDTPIWE